MQVHSLAFLLLSKSRKFSSSTIARTILYVIVTVHPAPIDPASLSSTLLSLLAHLIINIDIIDGYNRATNYPRQLQKRNFLLAGKLTSRNINARLRGEIKDCILLSICFSPPRHTRSRRKKNLSGYNGV